MRHEAQSVLRRRKNKEPSEANGNEDTHLKRLPRLPLPPRLIDLCPSHLLIELPLLHPTVILERKQQVQIGQFLEFLVVLPFFRLED